MTQIPDQSGDPAGRSERRRFRISVDWAAFVIALVVAAAVRLGVIARIPW
jgi:hypothetical protein